MPFGKINFFFECVKSADIAKKALSWQVLQEELVRDAKGFKQVPPHCTYWSYLKEKIKIGKSLGSRKILVLVEHGQIAPIRAI